MLTCKCRQGRNWAVLGPRDDWAALALGGAELGSHCPDCLNPALGMPLGKGLTAPGMFSGCGGAFTSSLGEESRT